MNLIEHYIGGKIINGSSSRKGKVFNPATGNQESEVLLGSKSDLDLAVQKAKQSFESWSNTCLLYTSDAADEGCRRRLRCRSRWSPYH